MLKHLVRNIGLRFGVEIKGISDRHMWTTVSMKPESRPKGNVLLSYRTSPFLPGGEREVREHTAAWECMQIAQTFLTLGYCVDVIYWLDNIFVPRKNYALFIDVHSNMERIGPMLNRDCVRVLHIVFAHWMFHNHAALGRHFEVQKRRGVSIMPRRLLEPARGIEEAHCATMLGNGFTESTYSFAAKPLLRIPISTQSPYEWARGKDFDACRRRYLWLGGTGLVHKGLDLMLEAFAGMPDYHLTVCGRLFEQDFVYAYRRELFETPNIHAIDWIDVMSPEFVEISKTCVGLIHPSCSEGQSGAVVTCLHAGLIPIISYESGVDVYDFGIILKENSVDEIRASVERISSLPATDLEGMSRRAWEYARTNHTRERFAEEYRKAVDKIMSTMWSGKSCSEQGDEAS